MDDCLRIGFCDSINEKTLVSKIKEFYTTKINHEIKNPLITLKSKLEKFQSNHNKFYSLIIKESPELELNNLNNYISIMISKIFNICDFLSKSENIKVNKSKIYLKEFIENMISTIKTDLKNEVLQNKIIFKSHLKNLSKKELLFTDERKLKQLILNSFYFFKSFNVLGSKIKLSVSVLDSNIKLSIIFQNKNPLKNFDISQINSFLTLKENNLIEEYILKELNSIDLLNEVESQYKYFLILIKKLSFLLKIDFSFKESGSDFYIDYLIPRDQECKDTIIFPLSDQETLKLSLREIWFDKSVIIEELYKQRHPIQNSSLGSNSLLAKNKNDSHLKNKVKFKKSSIIKIRDELKDLANEKKPLTGSYQYSKFSENRDEFSNYNNPFKVQSIDYIDYCDADADIEEYSEINIIENLPKISCKSLVHSPTFSSINNKIHNKKKDFKLKFLIVDDDITQRQSLERLLNSIFVSRNVSHEILTACDGIEALYKIMTDINKDEYNNPIKCIIMDENMKFLNGSKTLGMINQINIFKNYLKNSYIISLSSHYSCDFEEYLKKCGFNFCLTKPIEKSYLSEIISKIDSNS